MFIVQSLIQSELFLLFQNVKNEFEINEMKLIVIKLFKERNWKM